MRLYKLELYKLCHRKIFITGVICVIGLMLFIFSMRVSEEHTCIDGVIYDGYEAVQADRRITKEYEGILTDEKVGKIVERYGFPSEVEEYYGYYRDANFLSELVGRYLSNGYYNNWQDYEIADSVYPIEDTLLGEAVRLTGKDIILEYNNGWYAFLDLMQLGMLVGCILVLSCVSTTFSGERQTNMLQIIFTTRDGRRKDIYAKIAAAFTLGIGVWFGVVFIGLLLCVSVYGFSGLGTMIGMVQSYGIIPYLPATMLSVRAFIALMLMRSLLGIMLLCATVLCISAYCKNTFSSIVGAAISFGAPVLIYMLIRNGYNYITWLIKYLVFASPIYCAVVYPVENYTVLGVLTIISVAEFAGFIVFAYRKYRGLQVY